MGNLREAIMVKRENPFLSPIFRRVESKKQREDICDSTENQIEVLGVDYNGWSLIVHLRDLVVGIELVEYTSCFR